MTAGAPPTIAWNEADGAHAARWRSEAGWPVPRRVQLADDTLPADAAYRLVCEGTALLYYLVPDTSGQHDRDPDVSVDMVRVFLKAAAHHESV